MFFMDRITPAMFTRFWGSSSTMTMFEKYGV
jgi:hypothetical protein